MADDGPADDENQVLSRFHEQVARLALERVDERLGVFSESEGAALLQEFFRGPFVRLIVDEVVRVTLWRLNDDGFCSFSFHESEAEFETDGKCDICELTREQHVSVLVCRAPGRQAEFLRHRREMVAEGAAVAAAQQGGSESGERG